MENVHHTLSIGRLSTKNLIECEHRKIKWIMKATLGFKSTKMAYATIKGIEVMRALHKGQTSSFFYGQPQGELYL